MDISYKWLKQYAAVEADGREFMRRMNMSGTEIKGFHSLSDGLSNIAVGKITKIDRHPDADKLVVCQVDVGDKGTLQIVTAATNVFEGALVPVALHKSVVYGGQKITKGKLRGVESQGMFCSVEELGLTEHDYPDAIKDGILILKEGIPGESIFEVLGMDDIIFEADVATNRPDCLSVRGIAREASATFGVSFTDEKPILSETTDDDVSEYLRVTVKDSDLCPRYSARVVKNVRIASSPLWLVERLRNSGIRSINNIVDITNYVMLEYGQPMHAFDYSCVSGGEIIVRRAGDSKSVKTLDGEEISLNPEMLVIADREKPIALAGIMGGENSEITENTKTVVFESANFFGPSIRRTSKALGKRTDASSRYEKNIDPSMTVEALDRACQLVAMLDAGDVIGELIDVDSTEKKAKKIFLDSDWINKYINTNLTKDAMINILLSLGFKMSGEDVVVPSFRSDVSDKYDLSEEIARIYGYDNIKPESFKSDMSGGGYTDKQKFEIKLNDVLRASGLDEIYTYTFTGTKSFDKIRLSQDDVKRNCLKISNPLGEDSAIMRTTVLPSMLEVLSRNYNNRNPEAFLYELGKVFVKTSDTTLPEEKIIVTIGFYDTSGDSDFFTLKGMIENVVSEMNIKSVSYLPCSDNPSYHPGRCAEVFSDGKRLGIFGEIHPTVSENYEIGQNVYCAEISLDVLYSSVGEVKMYKPLPKHPASTRDLGLLCKNEVYNSEIENIIVKAGGKNLESVKLFDVYTGKQVADGYKSLAYALVFRKEDGTFSDEEVDAFIVKILDALKEKDIILRQ